VLVVTPALNSPLKTWTSDETTRGPARRPALDTSLAKLAQAGVQARGEVGDGDPLQGNRGRAAHVRRGRDHPLDPSEGRSNWLERGVVSKARERFAVPITHVVVDLEREREENPRLS